VNDLVEWFAREGWLLALAGMFVVIATTVVFALIRSAPRDDDEWGGGSF